MYNWQSLSGKFKFEKEKITFVGESVKTVDQSHATIGNAISDQRFAGGEISGTVRFSEISEFSVCQFIISYQPVTGTFLLAGIAAGSDNGPMFILQLFSGKWTLYGVSGTRANLEPNRDYKIKVKVTGSRITLSVDGVDVLMKDLPFVLPNNQVGLWCQDTHKITISDFKVESQQPTAFVVMQFTKPYDELYAEVIKPICESFKIKPQRADESYRQGLIIADIARQIVEAKLVIAEITVPNPNVYYEIGYAHALYKPTILIADENTQLPFDVRPFRVLYYKNSIDGKSRVEKGLRKHIEAIMQDMGLQAN